MRKNILFLASVLCTTLMFSQTKTYLDVPYLETSAQVDTLVKPDKIYLNITIQEKDYRGRKSVEEQENKMAQRLRALGIDLDKQLLIKDLSSNFKKYFLREKEVLKRKSYSLVVYSGKQAGEVLMALQQIGIANTSLEKTEYSKMKALALKLKSQAVKEAIKKANALTAPLKQRVGPALRVLDTSTPYYPRYDRAPRMEMEAVALAKDKPLDIDFEKIKVETTVKVTFKLIP